ARRPRGSRTGRRPGDRPAPRVAVLGARACLQPGGQQGFDLLVGGGGALAAELRATHCLAHLAEVERGLQSGHRGILGHRVIVGQGPQPCRTGVICTSAGASGSAWIVVWSMPNRACITRWRSCCSRSAATPAATTTCALIA